MIFLQNVTNWKYNPDLNIFPSRYWFKSYGYLKEFTTKGWTLPSEEAPSVVYNTKSEVDHIVTITCLGLCTVYQYQMWNSKGKVFYQQGSLFNYTIEVHIIM